VTAVVGAVLEPRGAERVAALPPGAIVVGDAGWWRVRSDGRLEEVLPSGWPRPGAAHATAQAARRRAA
jgi:hypothetical protein